MTSPSRGRRRRATAALSVGTLVAALSVAALVAEPTAPAGAATPAYHNGKSVRLANGVSTYGVSWTGTAGQVHANVISVNLGAHGTTINAALAHGTVYSSGEQVLSMATRTHAVAGVNGDFFDVHGRGAPWGGIGRSGVTLKSPNPAGNQSDGQFVVTSSGRAYIRPLGYSATIAHGANHRAITALNTSSAAAAGHLTLITPALGGVASVPHCVVAMLASVHGRWVVQTVHRGQTGIRKLRSTELAVTSCGLGGTWLATKLRAGYHVTLPAALRTPGVGAINARTFISGGRVLVKNGKPNIGGAGVGTAGRNPESLVGVSRDGRIVKLVVIDGRSRASVGVTMAEATNFLIHQGCYTAMLLDGGYSSIMVAKPTARSTMRVLNRPTGYRTKRTVGGVPVYIGLRPVADGLFVYASQ